MGFSVSALSPYKRHSTWTSQAFYIFLYSKQFVPPSAPQLRMRRQWHEVEISLCSVRQTGSPDLLFHGWKTVDPWAPAAWFKYLTREDFYISRMLKWPTPVDTPVLLSMWQDKLTGNMMSMFMVRKIVKVCIVFLSQQYHHIEFFFLLFSISTGLSNFLVIHAYYFIILLILYLIVIIF